VADAIVLPLRSRQPRGCWGVYCADGNLWEPHLTEKEAELETEIAQQQCDCGGPHEPRRMRSDQPRSPETSTA
jgi:hypothetical protein